MKFSRDQTVRIIGNDGFYHGQTGQVMAVVPQGNKWVYIVRPSCYHPDCPLNGVYLEHELEVVLDEVQ